MSCDTDTELWLDNVNYLVLILRYDWSAVYIIKHWLYSNYKVHHQLVLVMWHVVCAVIARCMSRCMSDRKNVPILDAFRLHRTWSPNVKIYKNIKHNPLNKLRTTVNNTIDLSRRIKLAYEFFNLRISFLAYIKLMMRTHNIFYNHFSFEIRTMSVPQMQSRVCVFRILSSVYALRNFCNKQINV